jgi:transglutaminase-like putative cysteine protease
VTPRIAVDVGIHTLLAIVGIVGLATSFDNAGWLLAGVGGLVVGTVAALVAKLLRLGAVSSVLLALAAFMIFGSALALPGQSLFGVIPTGGSLTSLMVGAVWGWNDLLTLAAPVDLPDYVTVVPYASAWLVGLAGATLAARWLPARPRAAWRSALLLIGPVLLYLASVLLGTREPFHPGVRGVLFAAVALVWLGWRRGAAEQVHVAAGGMLRRRIAATAGLVGAAIVLGAVSGAALVPPSDRFVLRERIEPPYEPLDFASPLAGFRQYSKLLEDDTLFTVRGLEPGQRLRLATMDAYDGHLWTVAGARISPTGSGSFALVGPEFPEPSLLTPAGAQSVEIEIAEYADVWIPGVGYPQTIDLPGASREQLQGLRYNAATGSAVLTGGFADGDVIASTSLVQQIAIADDDLVDVPVARVELAPVTVIPDIVAAKAVEFSGDAASPIEQLRAIELTLQSTGYFSRGTASDTTPSVAGHGADRMTDLFAGPVMVGDEEQYAAAFALMARSLGYPARVVMGFAPVVDDDGSVAVTGHDVTAWVEVAFEGVGWIPFDPTPDQTDVPQDQDPKPKTEPQPQVRQPPRSVSEPDDLVTAVEIDDGDSDDAGDFAIPGWLVTTSLAAVILGVLVLGPVLVIARVKIVRARRRRLAAAPHDAVRGAWDELVDQYSELGFAVPARATRRRTARVLAAQVGVAGLESAADRIDAAVFGHGEVVDTVVDSVWEETGLLIRAAREGVPPRARLRSRFRLKSVQAWLEAAAERGDAVRAIVPRVR